MSDRDKLLQAADNALLWLTREGILDRDSYARTLVDRYRTLRAAQQVESNRAIELWDLMRDEILHGDGTLDNDQTHWVLSIIDDYNAQFSSAGSAAEPAQREGPR